MPLSRQQWQESEQWQVSVAGRSDERGRPPTQGVFVTATSTEVGKTVVSAVLAHTLAAEGRDVAVFKPAVTGTDEFPDYDEAAALAAVAAASGGGAADALPARSTPPAADAPPGRSPLLADEAPPDQSAKPAADAPSGETTSVQEDAATAEPAVPDDPRDLPATWPSAANLPDHATLRAAALSSQTDDEICPYRFEPPMSPHLAAGLAGVEIDPETVMRAARAAADGADAIVCEGVGGLLVPLSPTWMVRNFAVELGYPVVVVSPPGLGAINHTLLTVESIRQVGLKVAAIVLNPWPEDPTPIESDNRDTISSLTGTPVLTLPQLDLARPDTWPELRPPD